MSQAIRHPEPLLYQTAGPAAPVEIAGPEHLITGLSWMLALLFLWG